MQPGHLREARRASSRAVHPDILSEFPDFLRSLPEFGGTAVFSDVVVAGGIVIEEDAIGDGRLEDGLHPIVIALRDGVELMIVAARAAYGEPKENCAGGIYHID